MSKLSPPPEPKFNDMVDTAIALHNLQELVETWGPRVMTCVCLAHINEIIGILSVDDLEDMKSFLFNTIEEIDGTIQMANSGPATTRE